MIRHFSSSIIITSHHHPCVCAFVLATCSLTLGSDVDVALVRVFLKTRIKKVVSVQNFAVYSPLPRPRRRRNSCLKLSSCRVSGLTEHNNQDLMWRRGQGGHTGFPAMLTWCTGWGRTCSELRPACPILYVLRTHRRKSIRHTSIFFMFMSDDSRKAHDLLSGE